MGRRTAAGPLVISLVLAVAGCSGTARRTITGDEAIKRLEGYLAPAVAAAPAGVVMRPDTAEATDQGSCTKFLSEAETGQVTAEVSYAAEAVAPDLAAQYFDALAGSWRHRWGAVDGDSDLMSVKISKGAFTLYAHYWSGTGSHRLEVGGSSECIWPDGTPGSGDDS